MREGNEAWNVWPTIRRILYSFVFVREYISPNVESNVDNERIMLANKHIILLTVINIVTTYEEEVMEILYDLIVELFYI